MAHLVKGLTLDFGLGRDLRVVRSRPAWNYVLGIEPD